MAKQTGPHLIKYNDGNVCFYVACGEGRVRANRPPASRRVKTAPEFAGLRNYANLLKLASPLASAMHKTIPKGRQRHHYQRLTGVAIQAMKAGKSRKEVEVLLQQEVALIGREIAEGHVTIVTHGAQLMTVKWKNGQPKLVKRRKKTTILKSGASIYQKQEFEALVQQQQGMTGKVATTKAAVKQKPVILQQYGPPAGLIQLYGAGKPVAGYYRRMRRRCSRCINFPVRSLRLSAGFYHLRPG